MTAQQNVADKRRHRRFRLSLLDVLGAMTLACLAVAAVSAQHVEATEERTFLAIVSSGLILGILLSRGFGGRGILLGTIGAAMGAAATMAMFQFVPWENLNQFLAKPRKFATVPLAVAVLISVSCATVFGLLVSALYAAVVGLIPHGFRAPQMVVKSLAPHWKLTSVLVVACLLSTYAIFSPYWGQVPRVSVPLNVSGEQLFIGVPLIASAKGTWWAAQDSSTAGVPGSNRWHVCHFDGSNLVRRDDVGQYMTGEIQFAPDESHFIQTLPQGTARIRRLPKCKIVCTLDDSQQVGSIQLLKWSDAGLAVVHLYEDVLILSLMHFDGQCVVERQRKQVGRNGDRVMAMGRKLDWYAISLMDDNEEGSLLRRVSDGKTIRRTESFEIHDLFHVQAPNTDGSLWISRRNCAFLTNDLALEHRRPFAWMGYPGDLNDPFPPADPYLYGVPFGANLLFSMAELNQLQIVDPKSQRALARFRAVDEVISSVTVTADNKFAGSILANLSLPDFKGSARLVLWDIPEHCQE